MGAVLQAARKQFGPYVLLGKIGSGSMATVYKARHADTGQDAAVKVMSQRLAADVNLTTRFARECKVARALDHPHIVRVLDFGLEGYTAYLVMEYVDGESLARRLERKGPIDEDEAVRLIAQVGRALDWAHQRRLVHRDIKPANILLSRDGRAKLNDLGLVKDLEGDVGLTSPADILGTPNFMAPEQFEDAGKADARSDLYSLAASLYMTVTGAVPFGTGSLMELMRRKLTDQLTAPRRLVPGLSARVESAILRGMRCHPKERQGSVLEFIGALKDDTVAAPAPAPAAPPGSERRRSRRYPVKRRTSCRPLSRSRAKHWHGEIVDISETGVCLQLERRFEPGTVLTLFINGDGAGSDDAGADRSPMFVRVMWAKKESAKTWRLGGQFDHSLCSFEIDELRKSPQIELAREPASGK
jgi:serine/threonine protein kinase